jgi:hypothetical protein
MTDFIAAILEIEKQYGPESAGLSWRYVYLKCNKKRTEIKYCHNYRKWNIVQDIIEDFIAKLQLKPSLATDLRLHFEKKYGEK